MAINKLYKYTISDYSWLGERSGILNTAYDVNYNELINNAILANGNSREGILIDPLRFNRYLPSNLAYRIPGYETFIDDVNWLDGKAHSITDSNPHDWNQISSTLLLDEQKVSLAELQWTNVFNASAVNATITFAYAHLGDPSKPAGMGWFKIVLHSVMLSRLNNRCVI